MTATAPPLPDVSQLQDERLERAPFPGRAAAPFRAYFDPGVHAEVHRHAAEDTSVEICGVLVGFWRRDDDGPYVHVTASIRGDAATSKFAEVTFTHETWARINARMDSEFADRAIVGWYHTHPDFGVFLSERDRFIHEHFFNAPGQIALVVDPVRRAEGVFVWNGGRPVPAPVHWVGGVPRPADGPDAAPQPARPRDAAQTVVPPGAPPSLLTSPAVVILAMLAVFFCGYMLAPGRSRGQAELIVQGLASQLYLRTTTLEAPLLIEGAQRELVRAAEEGARLTAAPSAGTPPPAPDQVLRAVADRLHRADALLGRARALYNLTPEQAAALDRVLAERTRQLIEAARRDPAPAPAVAPAPAAAPSEGGK